MRCINCNNDIPEASTFCPYCGAPAPQPEVQQPVEPNPLEQSPFQQNAYQPDPYQQTGYQQPAYQQPSYQQPTYQQPAAEKPAKEKPAKKPAGEKPAKKGVSKAVFIIVTVLLVLICLGLGAVLYYEIKELETANGYLYENKLTMEDLNDQITDLKNTKNKNEAKISSLESDVKSLESELSYAWDQYYDVQDDSVDYNQIVAAGRGKTVGHYSDSFYTRTPIVVMRATDSTKTIKCVDTFSGYHTIYVSKDGYSANASWASGSWTTEASLNITPNYKGVTTLTITNSKNTASYNIIVIVTD